MKTAFLLVHCKQSVLVPSKLTFVCAGWARQQNTPFSERKITSPTRPASPPVPTARRGSLWRNLRPIFSLRCPGLREVAGRLAGWETGGISRLRALQFPGRTLGGARPGRAPARPPPHSDRPQAPLWLARCDRHGGQSGSGSWKSTQQQRGTRPWGRMWAGNGTGERSAVLGTTWSKKLQGSDPGFKNSVSSQVQWTGSA